VLNCVPKMIAAGGGHEIVGILGVAVPVREIL
jgi:hypothetical protein